MQIIEINLKEGYPFYCPITGKQILTEDDFIPSPAMVYSYIQDEAVFGFINNEAKSFFKELIEHNYLEYERYDELLPALLDNNLTSSWVCFRLCSGGQGIVSYVVDICINMSFNNK